MYIYTALPVIARKTIDDGDVCINNETFEVLNFDDTHIYLGNTRPTEDDGEELHPIDVELKQFAKLFSLNYCSTTHKSQGETITEDFTIYDWNMMSKKCRYTALSRAKKPEQISFSNVYIPSETNTFVKNIEKKIKGHLKYDEEKGLKSDISVEKVQKLFVKQNGECCLCDCALKTFNYKKLDRQQFSIDRINSKFGHTDDNVQLLCCGCNNEKSNR